MFLELKGTNQEGLIINYEVGLEDKVILVNLDFISPYKMNLCVDFRVKELNQ